MTAPKKRKKARASKQSKPGRKKKTASKKKSRTTAPQRFRDRIVELRRMKASELLDNPLNWRLHPDEQRAALTSILDRIGIVGALIGRDTKDGIIIDDGHLRKDITGDDIVPVLITDLSEDEAAIMLATYDPLSDLAIMDAEALKSLLEQVDTEDDDDAFMRRLFSDVNAELAGEVATSESKHKFVEGMALEPHEHYDYLVVCAQTSHEWNVLCELLNLKPERRRARMGTSRAIRATRLLEKLRGHS